MSSYHVWEEIFELGKAIDQDPEYFSLVLAKAEARKLSKEINDLIDKWNTIEPEKAPRSRKGKKPNVND